MIDRPLYVNQIMAYTDTPFVKVLTGVRRCGKSTVLKMIMEKLQKEHGIPSERIVSMRFDSMDYEDMTAKDMFKAVKEKLDPTGRMYLFLDEVQEIEGWEKVNMYFLAIELINNLEKIQRRQFFRLPCTIDMYFYEVRYDDKAESEPEFCKKMYKNHAINSKNMNTVKSVILDISGGGIRFSLSTPLEEGTYFMAQFSLALEECTQQFNIVCKVIKCTQSLDYADRYFARSKFIFDRITEREKIVRFVFEEERRIRRREME